MNSQIVPLDDTWSQYVNHQLSFSIRFPNMMMARYGSCEWRAENGDHSYRPKPALVPVSIFENGDVVYIASEYYYELSEETCTGDGHCSYAECTRVTNSLSLLQDPANIYQQMWKFAVAEVHSDEELDDFIKSRFGSGCRLGEKTPGGHEGVYEVGIEGDGKGVDETECPHLHWTYDPGFRVRYCEDANTAIAMYLNGYSTFLGDERGFVTYDQEMLDSLVCESGKPH